MGLEYVNRAFIDIDGTVLEAESVDNSTIVDGFDKVKTMNRDNRARGFQRGVVMYDLTMTIPVPAEGLEIDFDEYVEEGTFFQAFIEYQGGKSKSFYDCVLSEVKRSSASGTVTKMELTFSALTASSDG